MSAALPGKLGTRRRVGARLTVVAVAVAIGVCGCGGAAKPAGGVAAPTHHNGSSTGSHAQESATIAAGRKVFASAGCARCHTLAAAGASGHVGPDLDQLKPSAATVQWQVTHGGGAMPSFASKLSKAQIEAVAQFVASVAGHQGG